MSESDYSGSEISDTASHLNEEEYEDDGFVVHKAAVMDGAKLDTPHLLLMVLQEEEHPATKNGGRFCFSCSSCVGRGLLKARTVWSLTSSSLFASFTSFS